MKAPVLYDLTTTHKRFKPKQYYLAHSYFSFYMDLDALEAFSESSPLLGYNRFNLYGLYDDDHFPGYTGTIKDRVKTFIKESQFELPEDAKIYLLSNLRFLGYGFNPVSFYYCLTASGEPLCAVAEVENTFYEVKPYFIPLAHNDKNTETKTLFEVEVQKQFYVSPFSELHQFFHFKLFLPDVTLSGIVNTMDSEGCVLASALTGKALPLTTGNLLKLTLRYPFVPLWVITKIHWHALKLWLKQVPVFAKESNRQMQTQVLRAHKSITEQQDI